MANDIREQLREREASDCQACEEPKNSLETVKKTGGLLISEHWHLPENELGENAECCGLCTPTSIPWSVTQGSRRTNELGVQGHRTVVVRAGLAIVQ